METTLGIVRKNIDQDRTIVGQHGPKLDAEGAKLLAVIVFSAWLLHTVSNSCCLQRKMCPIVCSTCLAVSLNLCLSMRKMLRNMSRTVVDRFQVVSVYVQPLFVDVSVCVNSQGAE